MHCRRRKIRCLVAPDDTQGRCENCIRLRKECHFFPVDQQPPSDMNARPAANLEAPSTDASTASSSPPTLGTGSMDQHDMYPYPIPLNSPPEVPGYHPAAFAGGPMATFTPGSWRPEEMPPDTMDALTTSLTRADAVAHPDYVPSQPFDPNAPWEASSMFDAQMKQRMGDPSPVIWTQAGPMPAVPTSSPMPGMPGNAPMIGSGGPAYALQPDGTMWPMPPQRAVTLSSPSDLAAQYPSPSQMPQQIPPEMKRRMTSTGQNMGVMATPSPLHSPSPGMQHLHGNPVPVNFGGPPMGYPSWNPMSSMPPASGYPMYPHDHVPPQFVVQHQPQPMGPPGHLPSSGA